MAKHPKTLRLASLLKCDRRYAVGLLHDLFSWGLDAAKKDGSLPGLSADEIAIALDFSGKKGADAVSALLKSGYLENVNGTFRIHDWYDYAGKFSEQREADKKRKKEAKNKKLGSDFNEKSAGNPPEIRRKSSGNPPVTVPIPNLTNNTGDNTHTRALEESEENDPDGFEAFWTAYPRKTGDIREAYMTYLDALAAGATPEILLSAAKDLAERNKAPEDFKHLSSAEKWLRNRGWLEIVPEDKPKERRVTTFMDV